MTDTIGRRRSARPGLVLAAVLLSLGLFLARGVRAGTALPEGAPVDRFARVSDGVYRSAQPDRAGFEELARRHGIRTVLKLNHGRDDVPPGMTVLHFPVDARTGPGPEQLGRILAALETAPRPVLVHCKSGRDRTGLVVALHRIAHGVPVKEARDDMLRRGFRPYPGLLEAWRQAVGAAAAGTASAGLRPRPESSRSGLRSGSGLRVRSAATAPSTALYLQSGVGHPAAR
jgi:protein tyrosine phosphatase (PTP) superfamily phosphohydrolase (DUF442 family)